MGIALTKRACPVCGALFDAEMIISKEGTDNVDRQIESLHGKCIGYLEKPCAKCQKLLNQNAFFVIGVRADKTADFSNPQRSGHLFAVKRSSKFFKSLPEELKKHDACYMDVKDLRKLGFFAAVKDDEE